MADQPVHLLNPYTLQLDFVRCMWAVLPGAMLWGSRWRWPGGAARPDPPGWSAASMPRTRFRHRRIAWREPVLIA